jgi:phosphonate transport system substrate-binding protein
MRLTRPIVLGAAAGVIAAVLFTWLFYRFALDIEGAVPLAHEEPAIDTASARKPVVYISVISRYPPNVISSGYQPMLDYMTRRSDYRFELKLCADYRQAVDMLLRREVAAAFLGSYLYITARREHGVLPILKPLNSTGEPFSRSALFVNMSSDIREIGDLRGRRLALPSEESYSANWLLRRVFARHGMGMGDLAAVAHLPHHQRVIQQVTGGVFDAGVTREHLLANIRDRSVRVLLYSEPFPTSPIVVARDHVSAVTTAIRQALLSLPRDAQARAALTRGWDREFVHGFVEAHDADYDAVRAIVTQ